MFCSPVHQRSYFAKLSLLLGICIAVFGASALAQPDVSALRTELVEQTGEAYIAVRTEALSLEQVEFDELLALLESVDPISQDHIIANALRSRRDSPEVATEFEDHIQLSLTNPILGSRTMKPQYRIWWPHGIFVYDPLGFEVILKYDLPLLHGFFCERARYRRNPKNLNSALYFARTKGIEWTRAAMYAAKDSTEEQIRITPIIVSVYKYWRNEGEVALTAYSVLLEMGTQLQLDALVDIVEFEEQLCPEQGFTPWDDPTIETDIVNAISNLNLAKKDLREVVERQVRDNDQPQELIDELTINQQAKQQEYDLHSKRLRTKLMWGQLNKAIAKLEAKLN